MTGPIPDKPERGHRVLPNGDLVIGPKWLVKQFAASRAFYAEQEHLHAETIARLQRDATESRHPVSTG